VVVADASRKGPVLHGLPERVSPVLFPPVSGNDSPLRAEKGLVSRSGDQVRPFGKWLLKVGPQQSQNMGHVVQDDGIDFLLPEEIPDLPDGFPVEDHAFAEDDQFRPDFVDDPTGFLHIDFVGIFGQYRKVRNGRFFQSPVVSDEVVEGAHGLCAEMAPADDVVVQNRADPSGFRFSIAPVQVIDQAAEDHGVGHLSAQHPNLDFPTFKIAIHLFLEQCLHMVDEIRPLVVEDLRIVVGTERAVFRVSEGRIHDRESPHHRGNGLFGGNQIDALGLAPKGILNRLLQQIEGLLLPCARERLFPLFGRAPDDRHRIGGGIGAQMPGNDDRIDPRSPDFDLHRIVLFQAAVGHHETNRPHLPFAGKMR